MNGANSNMFQGNLAYAIEFTFHIEVDCVRSRGFVLGDLLNFIMEKQNKGNVKCKMHFKIGEIIECGNAFYEGFDNFGHSDIVWELTNTFEKTGVKINNF